jgi:hypothetical protein
MHARLLQAVLLLASKTLAASPADTVFYQVLELPPDCSQKDVRRNIQQSAFGIWHAACKLPFDARSKMASTHPTLCIPCIPYNVCASRPHAQIESSGSTEPRRACRVATASQRVTTRHREAVGAGLNGASVTAV